MLDRIPDRFLKDYSRSFYDLLIELDEMVEQLRKKAQHSNFEKQTASATVKEEDVH